MGRRIRDWVVLRLFSTDIYRGNLGHRKTLAGCFPMFAVPLTSLRFSVLAGSLVNGLYTAVPEAGSRSQCLHYLWMP